MLSNTKREKNVVVDAFSRRHTFFCSLGAQILGFDNIRDLYALDEHFSPIYESCGKKARDGFYLAEGYLFKEGKLLHTPRINQEITCEREP